jgi:hypothetical protein
MLANLRRNNGASMSKNLAQNTNSIAIGTAMTVFRIHGRKWAETPPLRYISRIIHRIQWRFYRLLCPIEDFLYSQ